MNKVILLLIVHEAMCTALFYSVFCRAVRSCAKVRADVRFAFFLLGVVAMAGVGAPLMGFVPTVFTDALLASVALVQIVTAHHWDKGVPDRFYRPSCAPRNRRQTDDP